MSEDHDLMMPVAEWITCLGCRAVREPGEADRDCACVLGGFDAPAGEGVLDAEHWMEWVLSRTLPPSDRPTAMTQS